MNNDKRPTGPFVKKLAIQFATKDAIPKGGGLADGIAFIKGGPRFTQAIKDGFQSAFHAIDLIKASTDNPYGNDDEDIAKVIMDEIEKRKTTP